MAVNGGGGLRRWPRWYRRSYQAISGQSRRLTSAPGNNDARLDVSVPCRVRGGSVVNDGGGGRCRTVVEWRSYRR